MSAAGVQSARSNSSPVPWLRRCVASSKRRFIRSCSTIKSCNGFHCCDMLLLSPSTWMRSVLPRGSGWVCTRAGPAATADFTDLYFAISCSCIGRVSLEFHLVAVRRYVHGLPRQNFALQEFHRQRVLNQRLYRAFERTRTVSWIVTFAHQQLARGRLQHERHVPLVQHRLQPLELHVDDLADLLLRELMEDHDVVNAVQKLRFKGQPQLLSDRFTHLFLVAFGCLDLTRTEV